MKRDGKSVGNFNISVAATDSFMEAVKKGTSFEVYDPYRKKIVKKAAPAKKAPAMTCEVCGYRVIVDEACGCVEEHVLLCCNQPMTKS